MKDLQLETSLFAKKNGISLKIINTTYGKHFDDDKQSRHIFKCRLACNGRIYTFNFGQSIANGSERPTMYDVLTCLQKYDVGTFEDFCGEFGYDTDSRKAERTYKAVLKEWQAMERLFSPELLELLREIQ